MNQVVDPLHLAQWREQHIRSVRPDELTSVTDLFSLLLENNPIIQWINEDLSASRQPLIEQFLNIHYLDASHLLANDELTACISWSSPKDHPDKRHAALNLLPQLKKSYDNSKLAANKIKGIQQLQMVQEETRGYHINLLGVHPNKQRKGLSALLLKPLIEQSERRKLPISIELTDLMQVDVFRRTGFHVVDSYDLPSGPTIWRLNRSPV